MELLRTEQVTPAKINGQAVDLVIAASGYETRAVYFLDHFKIDAMATKLVYAFKDRASLRREVNDQTFRSHGFTEKVTDGDTLGEVYSSISNFLTQSQAQEVRILIDYSSMTRMWYGGIIKAIKNHRRQTKVTCFFSYTPASFAEATESLPNASVGPIPGFCSLDTPDKPTALIIGLGYERERALGLLEYVDPAICFAFYTNPPLDSRFANVIAENNAMLLKTLPPQNVYTHPLNDLQRASALLLSLYGGLKDDYRIILSPLGVKPFSLLCLLLSAKYEDIDVWRVSTGKKAPVQDRKPLGGLLILEAEFGPSPDVK